MKCLHRWLTLLAGATLFAFCGSAVAQAQAAIAGHLFIVVGEIRLTGSDGVRRTATRGSEVRPGDTIVTEAKSLAQIRLIDGGLVSVRAETEMRLDELSYAGQNDSKASMLVSLLKGGFRSITGLIARANPEGYRITTPTATIGIRGTDHEPFVQVPVPAGTTPPVPPGTYDYVREGQTVMRNREGFAQLIGANQVGFIGFVPGARPTLLPTLPSIYRTETPRPGAAGTASKPGAGAAPAERKPGEDKPAAAGPGAPRQPAGEAREPPRGTPMDSPRATPLDMPQSPAQQRAPLQQTTPLQQGAPAQPQSAPMQQGTPIQQTAPIRQTTPLQQTSPTQPQLAPIQQITPIQQVTPIQQTAPIKQPAPTTISPIIQTTPTTPIQPVPGAIR